MTLVKSTNLLLLIVLMPWIVGCWAISDLSGSSTRPYGSMEPFLEPDVGLEPIVSAIEHAKTSIRLETYLLTEREIIQELKVARARGVHVRLILEGKPTKGGTGNLPAINELAKANVDVRLANTSSAENNAKFMLVDDDTGIIMTLDLTRPSLTESRGFGIITKDPGYVSELRSIFEYAWEGRRYQSEHPDLLLGPGPSRRRLLEFIDGAKKTLDIEAGHLTDVEIETHLSRAVQRGVATRVVMSPLMRGPNENLEGLGRITGGGVQVRQTRKPLIESTMIIADGTRAFIGSHQFSQRSLDSNRELGILLTDKRTVDGLFETFVADWSDAK